MFALAGAPPAMPSRNRGLPGLALVEVVWRDRFRLGGIEHGRLIEVAVGVFRGDLFGFGPVEIELYLRRPPSWMKERWRGWLAGPAALSVARARWTGPARIGIVSGPEVCGSVAT